MVIHLSSTIFHQIREIEYAAERDVIETLNHLFSSMYHAPEGWYDPPVAARSSREGEIWQSIR